MQTIENACCGQVKHYTNSTQYIFIDNCVYSYTGIIPKKKIYMSFSQRHEVCT